MSEIANAIRALAVAIVACSILHGCLMMAAATMHR